MSASPEPTGDGELLALIDRHAEAVRAVAARRAVGLDCERARTALLAHIARHYVRRDRLVPDEWDDLDATAPVKAGYTAARGVLPRRPGDELPEDAIRRVRDGE